MKAWGMEPEYPKMSPDGKICEQLIGEVDMLNRSSHVQ